MNTLAALDARIPAWDLDDTSERPCPICEAQGGGPVCVRPDRLTVRRCGGCGTAYVSPAPSPAQLDAFYARYDERHRRSSAATADDLARQYARLDPLDDPRIQELSTLMNLQGANVLDVGFGRPQFLCGMKRLGAVPYGLELDPKAIDYARSLGVEHVAHGTLESYRPPVSFDLIAMIDLIEHPLEPRRLLRAAHDLLRPKGLVLIWTPNGDAPARDPQQTTFRVDLEHMQYLAPSSVGRIASDLRFDVAHLETVGFPDLAEISAPLDSQRARLEGRARLKALASGLPGFEAVNRLRMRLRIAARASDRAGDYHLFCILRKRG